MNTVIKTLFLVVILSSQVGLAFGHSRGKTGGKEIFPNYPSRGESRSSLWTKGPGRQESPRAPAPVLSHRDSLGNHVTDDHLSRVEFAHGRIDQVMKKDVHVTDVVSGGRAHFVNAYRPEFEHRTALYNTFVTHYNTVIVNHPVFLDVWHRHFFYGGFYYGFHPIVEIDTYFYNPMVYWFYVPTYNEYYYRNWYKDQYDAYPELRKPFEYHGVYYPTENLRQLLFGVSAMPVEKQAAFRAAISIFTRRLAQKMANGLGTRVQLSNGDVTVTHYENVGYDDAVVLEGFTTFRGQAYNFKGLIDLKVPEQTDVFVPATWDTNPTVEQLSSLDALNNKISAIKGEPSQSVTAEPQVSSPAATPAQVTADPE